MAESKSVFIIDNRAEEGTEKVEEYLSRWCNFSERLDIATGYFEIGALRRMDKQWQKLDKIRILMGDETSKSTKSTILNAINSKLDESFDKEKDENHFMTGIPEIMEAIRSKKIEIKVYTKHKFHAKLYITHPREELGLDASFALVGSSNFTIPGISKNIEMNVRIDPQAQVSQLRNWFEEFWEQGEDVSEEVFKTIERHAREYEPILVYGRSLEEYFRGRDATIDAWHEDNQDVAEGDKEFSQMWWRLDRYQKDGYLNLLKIADTHNGAFLCDGVGLGKTYIGLMLLEKLAGYDKKRVLLISPKSVKDSVWKHELEDKLAHLSGPGGGIYSIGMHSLSSEKKHNWDFIKNYYDAVVIDEGHHFRNKQKSKRYAKLHEIINEGARKQVFFLTATPINNGVLDLYRMISLFTNSNENHFRRIAIHNLKGHFMGMKRDLNRLMFDEDEHFEGDIQLGLTKEEADSRLKNDELIRALIVQRSRAYVRASMEGSERKIIFPKTPIPQAQEYDLKKVYGNLLSEFERAFSLNDPLFKLSIYYPFRHLDVSAAEFEDYDMKEGRLAGIVRLIRSGMLKRFESSYMAFKVSCHNLLLKNIAWLDEFGRIEGYETRLDEWMEENGKYVNHAREINPLIEYDEDADFGDYLQDIPNLKLTDWANEGPFNVEGIVKDAFDDIDQIVQFLSLMDDITPDSDDKVQKLVELLESDKMANNNKVIIFSEYMTTTKYLEEQLKKRIPDKNIFELHGGRTVDRTKVVRRFSPYYNNSSVEDLAERGDPEIDILISTDVLAEGLNLQDSVRLINYDIHWNPVRVMQRIGRIDRRMNQEIEDKIIADNPNFLEDRGNIAYWNFLPPEQLDSLLGLFQRVSGKYLQISKLLGIEGGFGLTGDQELDHMKDFNEKYQGKRTIEENLRLKYQELCRKNPELRDQWKAGAMPTRTFSGKRGEGRYAFFCYSIPGMRLIDGESGDDEIWTLEDGESRWYLYDLDEGTIKQETIEMMDIHDVIQCEPTEQRVLNIGEDELSAARNKIEDHLFNGIMHQLNVPAKDEKGNPIEPELTCWMSVG